MDSLTIRCARPDDLGALDRLYGKSYPVLLKKDYPPSTLVTAVPLISKAQPRLLQSGTYFVVTTSGGEILGAGGWTRAAPPGFEGRAGIGSIRHVVTDSDHTRLGIGRRLVAHIVRTAQEAGLGGLDCLSTITAVPFYEACGFRVLGDVTIPLRPGIDFSAVRMQRSL